MGHTSWLQRTEIQEPLSDSHLGQESRALRSPREGSARTPKSQNPRDKAIKTEVTNKKAKKPSRRMTNTSLKETLLLTARTGVKCQAGILEPPTLQQSNLLIQHSLSAYYGPEASKTGEIQAWLRLYSLESDGRQPCKLPYSMIGVTPKGCTKRHVKTEGGCRSVWSSLEAGQWSHSRGNDIHWVWKYEEESAWFVGRAMAHLL